jgi:hypothetical protein
MNLLTGLVDARHPSKVDEVEYVPTDPSDEEMWMLITSRALRVRYAVLDGSDGWDFRNDWRLMGQVSAANSQRSS